MLRFGINCAFRNAAEWRRPYDRFYGERLDLIAEADDLGFDTVWLTEHHFVDDGYLPSPVVMTAAIAARTSRIELGQGVLILPFYHPIRLAEDAAVIDNLSGGRMMLGLGSGYRQSEFDGYGVNKRFRKSLMDEGIAIITGAWTRDDFSFHGKRYEVENVSIRPKPMQQDPHPPIWCGARSDAATERAARLGLHLIPQRGYRQYQLYIKTLLENGHDPSQMRIARNLECIVTDEDPEKVKAQLTDLDAQHSYRMNLYHDWLSTAADAEIDTHLTDSAPPPQTLVIGTPDVVAQAIKDFQERYFVTDIGVASVPMGPIPEWFTTSLRRFAKEVVPLVSANEAEVGRQ